jgi:hypothetical protein
MYVIEHSHNLRSNTTEGENERHKSTRTFYQPRVDVHVALAQQAIQQEGRVVDVVVALSFYFI